MMQGLNNFVLGAGDVPERIKELQMYGSNTSHYGQIMMRQSSQRPNFACVVHAHFNYGNIVFRLEFEQLQRQADVVVEVAGALHHPQARHQQMGEDFFGRGLSC